MKQTFENFIELIKISCKKDPWTKNAGIKGYCHELRKESEEAIEAVEKKDDENLKEELGDILLDWVHICVMAEEKKLFLVNDVIEGATDKINRRKPYLKTGQNLSAEEARRIWLEVKEKEKNYYEQKTK
ncbi:MAG: hypothetical protein DRN66_03570 [Candidatus Nanohalarchaeota archaeon]|nr:MAG: hypothetical protein DRN66_03570 [Candidatus Nanohaloarchaeota archaeon]